MQSPCCMGAGGLRCTSYPAPVFACTSLFAAACLQRACPLAIVPCAGYACRPRTQLRSPALVTNRRVVSHSLGMLGLRLTHCMWLARPPKHVVSTNYWLNGPDRNSQRRGQQPHRGGRVEPTATQHPSPGLSMHATAVGRVPPPEQRHPRSPVPANCRLPVSRAPSWGPLGLPAGIYLLSSCKKI